GGCGGGGGAGGGGVGCRGYGKGSRRSAGYARGRGRGPHAWNGGHHIRNPTRRGHRARVRGAQRPRGGTLSAHRPSREYPPLSHQYVSAGRATADGAHLSRMGRSGRSDVLWSKRPGPVPARRQLCRQDSARGQAGRHPRRAAEQVRSYHQPYDSQGARPRGAPDAARPRRRGDRVKRREFITLIGGAAAAWPLAARAQQPGQVRRIGILMPYPKSDAEYQSYVRAFRQELARLGWSEGGNVQFDERWSTGDMDM